MPELKLLAELLDKMAEDHVEVHDQVQTFKLLLQKISKTSIPVHIEVDYDGREFHWRVHQSNMTASEYVPRLRR